MLTKWKIITALGLAAAGAVASGIAVLLQKLPPEEAAPAGEPQAKPKNLVTGSYSFISGFQDAATVEVCLDYDPEAFSFVVVEDEFLNYSSASHAAIVCGRDFNLQLEYAGYYNGEDFAAHKAALVENGGQVKNVKLLAQSTGEFTRSELNKDARFKFTSLTQSVIDEWNEEHGTDPEPEP